MVDSVVGVDHRGQSCYNSTMRTRTLGFAVVLALWVSGSAWAEGAVKGPLASAVGKIALGATREEVVQALGEPVAKLGPIGQPAIERWSYADGVQVVFVDGRATDVFIAR